MNDKIDELLNIIKIKKWECIQIQILKDAESEKKAREWRKVNKNRNGEPLGKRPKQRKRSFFS